MKLETVELKRSATALGIKTADGRCSIGRGTHIKGASLVNKPHLNLEKYL